MIRKIKILQILSVEHQQPISCDLSQLIAQLLRIDIMIAFRIRKRLTPIRTVDLPLIIQCICPAGILGQDLCRRLIELPSEIPRNIQSVVLFHAVRFRHRIQEVLIIIVSALFGIACKIYREE